MKQSLFLVGLLVVLGACWGATQPLAKIAVSEGYRHFGLVFWQMAIGTVLLGTITLVRGKSLPLSAHYLRFYALLAMIGTILPNGASFQALVYLPSGIVSILLSLVPMFAFPIALAFGLDRFSLRRFGGLMFGLVGVLLIIGPDASLPERAMVAFIPLALIAPFFYGLEGNVVSKWGTHGLDAIQTLFGASLIGTLLSAPLALGTGQWINPLPPYGAPDMALVLSSIIHALVYATYVWLVGRAGAVFAAQVSYLVTGFGVLWAILILGEHYAGFIWLAMAVMFVGLFLVQPRPKPPVVQTGPMGDDASS